MDNWYFIRFGVAVFTLTVFVFLTDFLIGRSCTKSPDFFVVFEEERNERILDKREWCCVDKSQLWLLVLLLLLLCDDESQSENPESPPHDEDVTSWRFFNDNEFWNKNDCEPNVDDNETFLFVGGVDVGILTDGDFVWYDLFDWKSYGL